MTKDKEDYRSIDMEIFALAELCNTEELSYDQAKFLNKELGKYKDAYYNKNISLIDDDLYDALEIKLVNYVNKNKGTKDE